MADTNAMLTRIRGLIDTADSLRETNPEAADNYQAKAEQLMVKYRIEEEELLAKDPTAVTPIWGDSLVASRKSPYHTSYFHLFYYIASHTGIKARYELKYGNEGAELRAYTVGYEADLRYAEALFTSAYMVFNSKLEPTVNRSLPEEENIYRLRAAGIERVRIADMIWGMGSRNDKRLLSKVGRVYAAECKRRGEEPMVAGRGVTGAAYREQYAEGFVNTLSMRLRQARDAAGRQGGGLVLHGRSERVQEAFYERFPSERPKPAVEGRGGAVATRCEKCAKSARGACKEHYIPVGRSSGGRDHFSAAAERGRAAGAAAARHVDLGRGGGNSIGGV
jgi:hypothetical protein